LVVIKGGNMWMQENIKFLALDMDGTLLTDAREIPESTVEAIHKLVKHGVRVVLSSARPVRAMLPEYRKLGLEELPLSALCGTCITWPEQEKYLYKNTISWDAYGALRKIFPMDAYYWKAYGESNLYVNRVTQETRRYSDILSVPYEQKTFDEETGFADLYRIYIPNLTQTERDEKSRLLNEVAALSYEFLESGVEILPAGTSKGSGVRMLCDYFKVPLAQSMAIGNEGSDISMVRCAGVGVAMGNASEALKEVADELTASNEEKGVERMLRKYWSFLDE